MFVFVRCVVDAGLDADKPTLFLCECVLVYLEPTETCALLTALGNYRVGDSLFQKDFFAIGMTWEEIV